MCPVCIAAAAVIAGKATGTGGLAVLVARTFGKFGNKQTAETSPANPLSKEVEDGQHHD